jgi:peptidoglycan hydrolase-like protein with peptidoglycan-binding domain
VGRARVIAAVVVVLSVSTAAGMAYGLHQLMEPLSAAGAERHAPDRATPTPTSTPGPPTQTRTARPRTLTPRPVLQPGAKGDLVRDLQHRLQQLYWYTPEMTGVYEATTREAVEGFQAKRGFEATGVVDRRTWNRLVSMTREPTHDEKHNILRAGPTILGPGSTGDQVRELQARLKQIGWFFGDVTGMYGEATAEAVTGFQAKREIPVTGEVDQRTLDRLLAMTREPTEDEKHNRAAQVSTGSALDPRCATGRALCVDKSANTLRWVVDGRVVATLDVRFGSELTPTREGAFSVTYKSRDHVSTLYDTAMPFAMFFSGGQAVHYSPDFAANGYNGASHGCVNVRDYATIAWLFDQVSIGDKVIVYWS